MKAPTLLLCGVLFLAGCGRETQPTVDDARKFLAGAEEKLLALNVEDQQADWVHENFITDDTEAVSAKADQRSIDESVRLAKEATRLDKVDLPEDMARKMKLLKLGLVLATPADPKESEEVTRLAASLDGAYGKGKYCPDRLAKTDHPCLDIEEITKIMATSTKPDELLEAWRGWHAVSPPMKKDFTRFVELSNKGARELGFKDTGAMWRSKYDMAPDDFPKELDRLWDQMRPLYLSLHSYVRWKLHEKYGDAVPATGPMPAHLLGNIWAQDWTNIYKLIAPAAADPGYDLTQILKARKAQPKGNGAVRRRLLQVPRLRAFARHLLEAKSIHQAAGSRRRLPPQRLGHRLRRGRAHQDVH